MSFFTYTGLTFWFVIAVTVAFAVGVVGTMLWFFIANWMLNQWFQRLKNQVTLTVPSNNDAAIEYVYPHAFSLGGVHKWAVVLAVNLATRRQVSPKILRKKTARPTKQGEGE